MSKLADVVPPDKKGDFYQRCIDLLDVKLSFSEFCEKVHALVNDYPNCKKWIAWYLRENIANLLFPACKSLNDAQLCKWLKISETTNGQEGLNNFIQLLTGRTQMTLAPLCETILEMILTYSQEYRAALEGMPICPKAKRPTKTDLKSNQEPKRDYKAAESAAELGLSKGSS